MGCFMGKVYSSDFYDYINAGSLRSARAIVPQIVCLLSPKSMLDVGCGAGAWCHEWERNGLSDILGIDGEYVDRSKLLIHESKFRAEDLSSTVRLGRKFDLVVSLEVAEHISAQCSDTFIKNLVSHGDFVLFSAAVPGQGGEFHVNEQPLEYWREKFYRFGFECFDPIRPLLANNKDVEPWYKYNTLLYVRASKVSELPETISCTVIDFDTLIQDVSPLSWRLRNKIISLLPSRIQDFLVKLKHWWIRRNF